MYFLLISLPDQLISELYLMTPLKGELIYFAIIDNEDDS